jgi:hypothetical protein
MEVNVRINAITIGVRWQIHDISFYFKECSRVRPYNFKKIIITQIFVLGNLNLDSWVVHPLF